MKHCFGTLDYRSESGAIPFEQNLSMIIPDFQSQIPLADTGADKNVLRNQYGRYVMIAMVDDRANLPQPKMWTLSWFITRFD